MDVHYYQAFLLVRQSIITDRGGGEGGGEWN